MSEIVPVEYPIQLGLAYLLVVGYLARTFFVAVGLPGAVGVIVSGFVFAHFIQEELLTARDDLQQLAFFLVLLTAGFEISISDLNFFVLVLSVLPATFELFGIALYSSHMLDFTFAESLVLGNVLFALGDGLVIPKMCEFTDRYPWHPMPRVVFTCAPLEACYALTLFGILRGVATPKGETSTSVPILVFANILRIVATVGVGALMGALTGYLMKLRTQVRLFGKISVFAGAPVEAFLFIMGVALAAFGLGALYEGKPAVPMGFAPGPLFLAELMVIVVGSSFAAFVEAQELEDVSKTIGGVWIFGQIVLFSMLGSKTDVAAMRSLTDVLPIMVVGLVSRLFGVLITSALTLRIRPAGCAGCAKADRTYFFHDVLFCFLSSLPRASIQGALGAVPVEQKFFAHSANRQYVQQFVGVAARLYIVCMSIVGSILLDSLGPKLLDARPQIECCEYAQPEVCQGDCQEAQKSNTIDIVRDQTIDAQTPLTTVGNQDPSTVNECVRAPEDVTLHSEAGGRDEQMNSEGSTYRRNSKLLTMNSFGSARGQSKTRASVSHQRSRSSRFINAFESRLYVETVLEEEPPAGNRASRMSQFRTA